MPHTGGFIQIGQGKLNCNNQQPDGGGRGSARLVMFVHFFDSERCHRHVSQRFYVVGVFPMGVILLGWKKSRGW